MSAGAIDDEPTEDDQLRSAWDWARACRVELERAVRIGPYRVPLGRAVRYRDRYEKFKTAKKRLDFADLLERVLLRQLQPSLDVLIVDEAQDLSPVQIALVELFAKTCSRLYVAGDDDQAIYGFGGANPAWLVALAGDADEVRILERSYRVPRAVHAVAQVIGARIGTRVPKAYAPRDAEGEVRFIESDQALGELRDGGMLLARTRRLLLPIARSMNADVVPFRSPIPGLSPLDGDGAVAVRAAFDLLAGREVRARNFELLLALVPCGVLAPWGTKEDTKRRQSSVRFEDLAAMRLGALRDHLVADGPTALPKLRRWQRDGLRRLIAKYGDLPEANVELSTIHRAKGREADTVVVLGEWGTQPSEALLGPSAVFRDGEQRVALVAVTRAKERLLLARGAPDRRAYAWPRPSR